jgi:hypothetical protein
MNQSAVLLVLTLGGLAILMVLAMVRFSAAVIADSERRSATKLWGAAYATTWGAICILLLRSATAAGATPTEAGAAIVLFVGGWGTFQAVWVWLWLSLERTNARATGQCRALAPAREEVRRRAGQLAVGGLFVIALAILRLRVLGAFVGWMVAPGHRLISATLTVAIAGFVLLIVGAVRLTLSRGESMSRAEIEEQFRSSKYGPQGRTGPLSFRRSTYRSFGPAKGAKAGQEVSMAAMKEAWRTGAWRRDPRWRTVFIMTAGGLMMALGGFGSFVVAGPAVVKVLCGGAVVYATFQLIAAFRRA